MQSFQVRISSDSSRTTSGYIGLMTPANRSQCGVDPGDDITTLDLQAPWQSLVKLAEISEPTSSILNVFRRPSTEFKHHHACSLGAAAQDVQTTRTGTPGIDSSEYQTSEADRSEHPLRNSVGYTGNPEIQEHCFKGRALVPKRSKDPRQRRVTRSIATGKSGQKATDLLLPLLPRGD